MWRCVQHLFYHSVNPQAPASDEPIEPHSQETPSTLDPIHDAGAVDLVTLRHAFNGIPIFDQTFNFIDGPEWIDRAIADANIRYPKPQFVHDRFTRDLMNLTSWRVTAQVTSTGVHAPDTGRTGQRPHFWSGYFTVPKNDVVSRSILNGKRFSRCCPASPPVNLIDVRGLRHLFRRTTRRKGRVRAIQGDFRHFFHQITISAALAKAFGLGFREGPKYLWCRLPMGWSFSPHIAQAVGWMCLLWHDAQSADKIFDIRHDAEHLPTFLTSTSGRSTLTLFYDNFLFLTDDDAEFDRFHRRWAAVDGEAPPATQRTGVVVKEGSFEVYDSQRLIGEGITYLGINFKLIETSTRRRVQRRWEMRPGKIEKWRSVVLCASLSKCAAKTGTLQACTCDPQAKMPELKTLRQCASLVGKATFCAALQGRRIGHDPFGRSVIRLASQIARLAQSGKKRWDEAGLITPQMRTALQHMWVHVGNIQDNPVLVESHEKDPTETSEEEIDWILATDASKKAAGWILYSRDRTRPDAPWVEEIVRTRVWSPTEATEHIYVLEMQALVEAAEDTRARRAGKRGWIVGDNAAVFFGIKSGVTNHEGGMRLMQRMFEPEPDFADHAFLVKSEDNPSDCPSRRDARGGEQRERFHLINSSDIGWPSMEFDAMDPVVV